MPIIEGKKEKVLENDWQTISLMDKALELKVET